MRRTAHALFPNSALRMGASCAPHAQIGLMHRGGRASVCWTRVLGWSLTRLWRAVLELLAVASIGFCFCLLAFPLLRIRLQCHYIIYELAHLAMLFSHSRFARKCIIPACMSLGAAGYPVCRGFTGVHAPSVRGCVVVCSLRVREQLHTFCCRV